MGLSATARCASGLHAEAFGPKLRWRAGGRTLRVLVPSNEVG